MMLLLVLAMVLAVVVEGSFPAMQAPPDFAKKDVVAEAKQIKKEADQEELTEEQFYRCFTDINCHLGKEAHDAVFTCYGKVNESERAEYARWFKDCPKGDFQESDLTFYGVNAKFCTLTPEDQKANNDYFAGEVAANLKDLCKLAGNRGRCLRLKKSADCISRLITEYVTTGKCDTIVKKIPGTEGMTFPSK